jgi:hypothetical protein
VILKRGQHIKYLPHAFTEHGAVMLANLLKSPVAIQASIQVVRAFVHLRRTLAANEDFARKLETIERTLDRHDVQLNSILSTLDSLFAPEDEPGPQRPIGFVPAPAKP